MSPLKNDLFGLKSKLIKNFKTFPLIEPNERRRCKEYQKDVAKQPPIDSNSLDEDDDDEFSYNEDISEVDTLNEVIIDSLA